MVEREEAEAAFLRLINNAPGMNLRKSAKIYWDAFNSATGASEKDGEQFEAAIKVIKIDFRTPALQCLEKFNECKASGEDIGNCYFTLAIQLAKRVVHG